MTEGYGTLKKIKFIFIRSCWWWNVLIKKIFWYFISLLIINLFFICFENQWFFKVQAINFLCFFLSFSRPRFESRFSPNFHGFGRVLGVPWGALGLTFSICFSASFFYGFLEGSKKKRKPTRREEDWLSGPKSYALAELPLREESPETPSRASRHGVG